MYQPLRYVGSSTEVFHDEPLAAVRRGHDVEVFGDTAFSLIGHAVLTEILRRQVGSS